MNKTWPTLYKKNSNGSIQQWTISVQTSPDGHNPFIQKEFGQMGGKLQVSDPDWIKGKNIGKANETTPYEQALLEAEAQWTKKKTGAKGYVESIDDAEAGKSDALVAGGVLPMLAHPFTKHGHKIVYPAYAQPKLDGIRCTAVVEHDGSVTLWTRTRKPIVSVPHIAEQIASMSLLPGTVLDGELYNHGYKDRFEDIVSLVRPEYVKEGSTVVEFHLFDMVSDAPYEDRYTLLSSYSWPLSVVLVETIEVESEEDLIEAFENFRAEGYEGAIVRNARGLYVNKRSYDLQKIKEFDTEEFPIVDVIEGRGKMAGRAVFVCRAEGGEFNVKMEGSLDQLTYYFEHPDEVISKNLTVRFQGWTNGNVPRFPIGVAVRDYE